jgi:pyruvate,water dikinase
VVSWQPLARFRDRSVPKLHNLARAGAAGLRVPPTWWIAAASVSDAARAQPPPELHELLERGGACIIRSGSPTEDTTETSNAGQLLSLPVREGATFGAALARVIEALPRDEGGRPRGVAFVQPLVEAEEAGVAFLDDFYFEKTVAGASNEALTSGQARGRVERGHLMRGEPWSQWLARVRAVFRADAAATDIEFARDRDGYLLLQARPALFELARNPILSLANHKEILGDPPSPWIVSVLIEAGRGVLGYYAEVDAAVGRWQEHYAIELAERAWMNFSFFFRLMDRWGLPRKMVAAGVGGEAGGPDDARVLWPRFLASAPRLVLLQLKSLWRVATIASRLTRLDRVIDAAASLDELHTANVAAMELAISTNFAIASALTAAQRVRTALGIRGDARVVTQEMMEAYGALARVPAEEREAALDAWLAAYGHRGPLESDPARPRFAELRADLMRDLASAAAAPPPAPPLRPRPSWLAAPFYALDARREWFRDQLMLRWQRLRGALLAEGERLAAAGRIAAAADVFWLRGADLDAEDLGAVVTAAKERVAAAASLSLPHTAPRDELARSLEDAARAQAAEAGRTVWSGIALDDAVVEGRALCARDLPSLLGSPELGADVILVVAALEPSWAVVFPRVGGVVAEIGGELSHASILLREARRPAIVNVGPILGSVKSGDRLRLDGRAALVELVR